MTVVTIVTVVPEMDRARLAERRWLLVTVPVVIVGTLTGRRWTLARPLRSLIVDGPCLFAPPLRERGRVKNKALDVDAGGRRMPDRGRTPGAAAVQLPCPGDEVVPPPERPEGCGKHSVGADGFVPAAVELVVLLIRWLRPSENPANAANATN